MQDTKPASPTKEVWPSQDTLNKRKQRGTRERKGEKGGEAVNTQNPTWSFTVRGLEKVKATYRQEGQPASGERV